MYPHPEADDKQPGGFQVKGILLIVFLTVFALSAFLLWSAKKETPQEVGYGQPIFSDTFNGVASPEWKLWRMQFAIDKDNFLKVVSAPRPGFNYGHWGNGRAAAAFTHIGDQNWKDYRLSLDVWGGGAGEFNPHGIDQCLRGSFEIHFRVVDSKENWNEPSRTDYMVTLNPIPQLCEGKEFPESGFYRTNNWYAAKEQGWCGGIARNYFIPENKLSPTVTNDVEALWRELVKKEYLEENGRILERIASLTDPTTLGLDPRYENDQPIIYKILKSNYCPIPGGTKELAKIDGRLWNVDKPNHVVVEVQGRNISVIVNGGHALGYYDDSPDALLYGGIGVQWGWDNVGWIDNVVVTKL